MSAATRGDAETVKLLLAAGADVNARIASGQTALTYAREENHPEIIRLLQEAGAR